MGPTSPADGSGRPLEEPVRRPPRGVPRWLWPPPGATVTRAVIREESTLRGPQHAVVEGAVPGANHLRALQWLVGEFPREDAPPATPGVVDVLLEIARTDLPKGRVGHAYALNGNALGTPSGGVARGVLWRYALSVLGKAPEAFEHWSDDF